MEMETIYPLLRPRYLKPFSYYEWPEGNAILLDIDNPEGNVLRKRTAQGNRKAVETFPVESFDEFSGMFMGDDSQRNLVGLAFRGQAGNWPLQSTLTRYWSRFDAWQQDATYNRLHPEMRDRCNWESSLVKTIVEKYLDQDGKALRPPCDQLWAILQHYGAPTPLLDWTLSLDVALYFAFDEVPTKKNTHAYIHMVDIGKVHKMNHPEGLTAEKLLDLGYSVPDSTWAFVWPSQFGDIRFATQQGLFAYQNFIHPDDMIPLDEFLSGRGHNETTRPKSPPHPGTLLSISIPAAERPKVMSYLDSKSISSATLFPDWETICSNAVSEYRNYLMDPDWQNRGAMSMGQAQDLCKSSHDVWIGKEDL